jgi:peroxiredoxin Q/BCP
MTIRLVALLGASLVSAAVHAAPGVGDLAPDFTLMGSDGQEHSLGDLRGDYVVIAFFPKAFTGGCTIECKALRDSDREIRKYDVAYFMASVDQPADNRAFAEKNDVGFPILSDPDKTVVNAYGALNDRGYANRWTFYIDAEGTIARIDKNVNPATAGADLVANLQALEVPLAEAPFLVPEPGEAVESGAVPESADLPDPGALPDTDQ